MQSFQPINVRDLLYRTRVEPTRVEFKANWDPQTTGGQVLRTICALANDFQNLNGGYIVIGVEESDGEAILPAKGLPLADLDRAQKWIRGKCAATFSGYMPVLSPEQIDDKSVLVVWAPPSEHRPHQAPNRNNAQKYWIRIGSETIDAEANGMQNALMQRSVQMPWDNQVAHNAQVQDLSETLVREHLHDVGSTLRDAPDTTSIYRSMGIIKRVNGNESPKNVGLLFFSPTPKDWFPGARIVVARFSADRAGPVQDEHVFRGPLPTQLRDCLGYLEGLSRSHLKKEMDRSQARGWVSYPIPALREALVNAVYHRSYRPDNLEPTKVALYPDRMEIISYPGPVPGVEKDHLLPGASIPPNPAPARNPRVGEFLKQLQLAEEWRTGLPRIYKSMADNGSPNPIFDFDDGRQWFRVTLPAHPEYAAVSALQDAAYLRTVAGFDEAFNRVRDAWEANEASAVLAAEFIQLCAEKDDLKTAEDVFCRFRENGPRNLLGNVANRWIEVLLRNGRTTDARKILDDLPEVTSAQDAVDSAILAHRLKETQIAHKYFKRAEAEIASDARALLEYAQTKMKLAMDARNERKRDWQRVNRRLLLEARELLERVVQMDSSPTRHAWAWRELGRVRNWLREPAATVEDAYVRATRLLPDERRFFSELEQIRKRRNSNPTGSKNSNTRTVKGRM